MEAAFLPAVANPLEFVSLDLEKRRRMKDDSPEDMCTDQGGWWVQGKCHPVDPDEEEKAACAQLGGDWDEKSGMCVDDPDDDSGTVMKDARGGRRRRHHQ